MKATLRTLIITLILGISLVNASPVAEVASAPIPRAAKARQLQDALCNALGSTINSVLGPVCPPTAPPDPETIAKLKAVCALPHVQFEPGLGQLCQDAEANPSKAQHALQQICQAIKLDDPSYCPAPPA